MAHACSLEAFTPPYPQGGGGRSLCTLRVSLGHLGKQAALMDCGMVTGLELRRGVHVSSQDPKWSLLSWDLQSASQPRKPFKLGRHAAANTCQITGQLTSLLPAGGGILSMSNGELNCRDPHTPYPLPYSSPSSYPRPSARAPGRTVCMFCKAPGLCSARRVVSTSHSGHYLSLPSRGGEIKLNPL